MESCCFIISYLSRARVKSVFFVINNWSWRRALTSPRTNKREVKKHKLHPARWMRDENDLNLYSLLAQSHHNAWTVLITAKSNAINVIRTLLTGGREAREIVSSEISPQYRRHLRLAEAGGARNFCFLSRRYLWSDSKRSPKLSLFLQGVNRKVFVLKWQKTWEGLRSNQDLSSICIMQRRWKEEGKYQLNSWTCEAFQAIRTSLNPF